MEKTDPRKKYDSREDVLNNPPPPGASIEDVLLYRFHVEIESCMERLELKNGAAVAKVLGWNTKTFLNYFYPGKSKPLPSLRQLFQLKEKLGFDIAYFMLGPEAQDFILIRENERLKEKIFEMENNASQA